MVPKKKLNELINNALQKDFCWSREAIINLLKEISDRDVTIRMNYLDSMIKMPYLQYMEAAFHKRPEDCQISCRYFMESINGGGR